MVDIRQARWHSDIYDILGHIGSVIARRALEEQQKTPIRMKNLKGIYKDID
jgi:hypothetical protein